MTGNILVYGNCQAGVFADMLRKVLRGSREVWHVMSFDHPTQPQVNVPQQELDTVVLILEQIDSGRPMREALLGAVASTALIVRFPPLDFNLLWPFNFKDPRSVSEPPLYPFGRFPYGDRTVVELLREGLVGSALWDAYRARSIARLPDLDRLRDHEIRRLSVRDQKSDVKVAELVISQYTSRRLFWTINHPTGWLLGKVFGDILFRCQNGIQIDGDIRARAESLFENYEPLGGLAVPIHPEVARQLELQWWAPDARYQYLDGTTMTFDETMRRYIDFARLEEAPRPARALRDRDISIRSDSVDGVSVNERTHIEDGRPHQTASAVADKAQSMSSQKHITFHESMADALNANFSVAGKIVLEIASDPWLLAAKRFVELRASRVIASDMVPDWAEKTHPHIEMATVDARRADETVGAASVDIVSGINLLEHLRDIPKALASLHRAIKPGGFCFLHGHPLWTSSRGHHAMLGHRGAAFTFADETNPIPLWAHLYMNPQEMRRELAASGAQPEVISAALHWAYESDLITRTTRRQIIREIESGPFRIVGLWEDRLEPADEKSIIRLRHSPWWDPDEDYGVRGLTYLLAKD